MAMDTSTKNEQGVQALTSIVVYRLQAACRLLGLMPHPLWSRLWGERDWKCVVRHYGPVQSIDWYYYELCMYVYMYVCIQ